MREGEREGERERERGRERERRRGNDDVGLMSSHVGQTYYLSRAPKGSRFISVEAHECSFACTQSYVLT